MSRYFFSKLIALIAGIILLLIAYNHNANSLYVISGNAYGTTWSVSSPQYIADNHKEAIKDIINDIDYIASNYKSKSEISKINLNFKQFQFVSDDLFEILKIAKSVEDISDGYYNIMLGKISSSLGFAPDFGKKSLQKKLSTYELDEKNNSHYEKYLNFLKIKRINFKKCVLHLCVLFLVIFEYHMEFLNDEALSKLIRLH